MVFSVRSWLAVRFDALGFASADGDPNAESAKTYAERLGHSALQVAVRCDFCSTCPARDTDSELSDSPCVHGPSEFREAFLSQFGKESREGHRARGC